MTKQHTIERIAQSIDRLDAVGLEQVADFIEHLAGDTVYSSLPEAEIRVIDDAIESLDRGDRVPGEQVFRALRARINAAQSSS